MALIPSVVHRFQRWLGLGTKLRADQRLILHTNVVVISPLCVFILRSCTYLISVIKFIMDPVGLHTAFLLFFLTGLIAYTICHINLSDCEI